MRLSWVSKMKLTPPRTHLEPSSNPPRPPFPSILRQFPQMEAIGSIVTAAAKIMATDELQKNPWQRKHAAAVQTAVVLVPTRPLRTLICCVHLQLGPVWPLSGLRALGQRRRTPCPLTKGPCSNGSGQGLLMESFWAIELGELILGELMKHKGRFSLTLTVRVSCSCPSPSELKRCSDPQWPCWMGVSAKTPGGANVARPTSQL